MQVRYTTKDRYGPGETVVELARGNYHSVKLHTWGCIAPGFRLLIDITDMGNIDGEKYEDILRLFLPYFRRYRLRHPNVVFQHDGASVHGTKNVDTCLEDNHIVVLGNKTGWPANSPDLSPIENMWAIVSQKVQKALRHKGAVENFELVQKCWDDVPVQIVNNLVESFHSRLEKVKTSNGGPIDY
jgi:hypothetical protein